VAVTGTDVTGGVDVPPGGAVLESNKPSEVRLGRYGDPVQPLGSIPADEARELAIPVDASSVPWRVALPGATRVKLCPVPG
jgi:hypothetical protein